jgi:NitT/TauT family transport system substrate-binding protein
MGWINNRDFKYFVITIILLFLPVLVFSCTGKKKTEVKVRMGYLQSDLHQLAAFVAFEKGLFEKEDISMEIGGIFKAGPEEMSAFAAGSLDIGYVGVAPATTAVANKTANVRVLAQANKEGSAVVVGRTSNIKSINDLREKTIAIPGFSTVQDFLLRKALIRNGLGFKEVKIIVIKPPEMIWALESGDIDAFIAWEPHVAKTITKGIGRILVTSRDIWEHHPCCVLVADLKFMEKHPELVRKIVKVHVDATNYIKNHPEEAVKIGIKYTGMDEATIRQAMKNIEFDYQPSVEGEVEYVDFLNRLGYIKITSPKTFTRTFIDSRILKEIIKR